MDIREFQAILIIVLRNLSLTAWKNLMPEAQSQILEECATLMNYEAMPKPCKQKLNSSLNELQYHTTDIHRQRIQQILSTSDKFSIAGRKFFKTSQVNIR